MPKNEDSHSVPVTTEELPNYVPSLRDAAQEAAARINVVIRLIREHECVSPGLEVDPRDLEYDGGWDLSIVREALVGVRNTLLDSLAARDEA